MTVNNNLSVAVKYIDENEVPRTHLNSPQKSVGKEECGNFAKQSPESPLSKDIARLAILLPSALAKMEDDKAKAELQKYAGSPLLRYLVRNLTEERASLLKVFIQQLFKHGMLFDAVGRAFKGEYEADSKFYDITQKAVYEHLRTNVLEITESEEGFQYDEPKLLVHVPFQKGGVSPSLFRLQEIVASQARKVIEKSLGYNKKFLHSIAAATDAQGRLFYGAIEHARELVQAKVVMMLQFQKKDILIQIPDRVASEDGQEIDQSKLSKVKLQVQRADIYCVSLVKIANACKVQIPKIAMAYVYGTSPDRQMRRFDLLKVRDREVIKQNREVCVLELLSIWAGNEALFRQIIVSHASSSPPSFHSLLDNAKDFPTLLNQFDARNKMIETIAAELARCIDCSNVIHPSRRLKTLFLSGPAIRDLNLIDQQIIVILQTLKENEIVSLLKSCPTLKDHLKKIQNPPAILNEAFRLLRVIEEALSDAENRSYKKTRLYKYLLELGSQGSEDHSYLLESRFFEFSQELIQTLCNENTMAFVVAKDGSYPLLTQFSSKSDEEQVEFIESILTHPKMRRELEIESIRYRDTLLLYMRQAGSEYLAAVDQEKAAKREVFVEALLDMLPIYPSKLISIHDMPGMDEAVRADLRTKKALYSPIPELMQEFVLGGWARE